MLFISVEDVYMIVCSILEFQLHEVCFLCLNQGIAGG